MYPEVRLYIDGDWRCGSDGGGEAVLNPATGQAIGRVPHASRHDLDAALDAAKKGFDLWRTTPAFDRSLLMRKAANILRSRADAIARTVTLEQGKPLAESRRETLLAGDLIDWVAEEARRTYGRVVPARAANVVQIETREPVGPVAAFTPWNFPINQAVRKVSAALAAGCSMILKGPEETPASCMELVRAFADAGIPPGVLNLVFGVPAEISDYLISHAVIRKISFTGSTVVGKHLAALAGKHMKRVTMELGGHAPAIVCGDADLDAAVRNLVASKFRNAGQVCVAPSRFLVHQDVYEPFVEKFAQAAKNIVVGDGLAENTQMGPLANDRRVQAMEAMIADALAKGARLRAGGRRIGKNGFFFAPTVLTDAPKEARVMNEEPFGPIAPIAGFSSLDEAIAEANRLSYGLAAYAYTRSAKSAAVLSTDLEAGMVSINHYGLALPELHFGGIKESGYGSEGGADAIDAYLFTKLVTRADL